LIQADVILIATPEYIHSIPAVLKNLFEWTVASGEFYEKHVAVWTAQAASQYVLPQVMDILRTMTAFVVDEASGQVAPGDEPEMQRRLEALVVAASP
ncbi:MAG: NAD(P)H-dependent oxidoreductase, partial [bacterium]